MLTDPSTVFNQLLNFEDPLRSEGFSDGAAHMKTRCPPEYVTDRNRGLISTQWMMVMPWNIYACRACRGGEGIGGVCLFGLNPMPYNSAFYDLKSKTGKKKREWGKERKKGNGKEGRESRYWFGGILLFAVAFQRSKSFVDSAHVKSQVLISP